MLTFKELRTANVKRCNTAFSTKDSGLEDWSPTDWACAMAGETGEAAEELTLAVLSLMVTAKANKPCDTVKKLKRLDTADSNIDSAEKRNELKIKIGKELADMLIYADLLAARLDIDLGDAVVQKFNEVSDKRGSNIKLGFSVDTYINYITETATEWW